MASKRNGTLYTGVTDEIFKRSHEHKFGMREGFTKKYGVHRLVYFETHVNMADAMRRERQIKEWKRKWKLELIEKHNPEWNDLYGMLQELDPDFRRD